MDKNIYIFISFNILINEIVKDGIKKNYFERKGGELEVEVEPAEDRRARVTFGKGAGPFC